MPQLRRDNQTRRIENSLAAGDGYDRTSHHPPRSGGRRGAVGNIGNDHMAGTGLPA
jgi:hypothetical protein